MDHTFTQNLLNDAPAMFAAMSREPKIGFDLSAADLDIIVLTMFCAMWNGIGRPDELYDHLRDHRANIRWGTFDFLLRAFDGTDWGAHLWAVDEAGNYAPLVEALPTYWEDDASVTLPAPKRRVRSVD